MKTTAVILLVVIVAGTMSAMAASFYFMANPKIVTSNVVMTTSQTETQQNYITLTEKTRTSTSNSL
ncbi:MAG: hypothetical protein ACLPY5_03550 [Candidatus Bathyarchaeia archaeon]